MALFSAPLSESLNSVTVIGLQIQPSYRILILDSKDHIQTGYKQTPSTSRPDMAQIHCLAERCFLRTGVCPIVVQIAPG